MIRTSAARGATAARPLCGPWQFAPRDRRIAAVTGFVVWTGIILVGSGALNGGNAWQPPAAFLPRDDWQSHLAGCLGAGWWTQIVVALASVYALFASRYARVRSLLRTSPTYILMDSRACADLNQTWVRGLSGVGEWLAFLPLAQIIGVVFLPLGGVFLLALGISILAGLLFSIGVFLRAFGLVLGLTRKSPLGDWLALAAFAVWQLALFPVLFDLWRLGLQLQ